MRIFNVILNGDDVKEFCKLSKESKIAWIKQYTNQKDNELIADFLNNPPKHGDCGCGCGDKKAKVEIKKVIPEPPKEIVQEQELLENIEELDVNDNKSVQYTKRPRFRRE